MPVFEAAAPPNAVKAADKAADLAQHVGVVKFWLTAGAACSHRKTVPAGCHGAEVASAAGLQAGQGRWGAVQCQAGGAAGFGQQQQGRHHGDFGLGQFERKSMLFHDLGIAPALRPVELRHHSLAVFQHDLENAVFV